MSQAGTQPKLSIGAKSPSGSSQTIPTASATQQYFSSSESRRSGQASAQIQKTTSPRNNQQAKSKHKGSKRFRPLPDDDADAETFSMQNPHGRRGQQSITHLMQFALPPRPTHGVSGRHSTYSSSSRRKTWGLGSGYHAMDKARSAWAVSKSRVLTIADIFTPTIASSYLPKATTRPMLMTLIHILIGTMYCKSSHHRRPKHHPVQSALANLPPLGWQSAGISSVFLA